MTNLKAGDRKLVRLPGSRRDGLVRGRQGSQQEGCPRKSAGESCMSDKEQSVSVRPRPSAGMVCTNWNIPYN